MNESNPQRPPPASPSVTSSDSKRAAKPTVCACSGCSDAGKLAGLNEFDHLQLHEIGLRKCQCPVTEERIATGVEAARSVLAKS